MPKKPSGGSEQHPKGPMIDIGPAERSRLLKLRGERGLTQAQLAARAGVTNGTISNVESGKSKQVRKAVYAAIVRALKAKGGTTLDEDAKQSETFQKFVAVAADLTAEQLEVLLPLVENLRKPG